MSPPAIRRAVLLTVAIFAFSTSHAEDIFVKTPSGLLMGSKSPTNKGVHIFKGIPYAVPPTGSRRWRPAETVQAWAGLRMATNFGPDCMQPTIWPPEMFYLSSPHGLMSEDCLYLNVWAPAATGRGKPGRKLPVMVWLHGGALTWGSGSLPLYDGTELARKGVLVVTLNYRLGVFGFFTHPELAAESPHNATGNYGLSDQIVALEWVRDNISSFGGDSDNITVFGESAGARSIALLMISPPARGLFHRAIAQSTRVFYDRLTTPQDRSANQVSSDDPQLQSIPKLRSLTATEVMANIHIADTAVVDGWIIPEQVRELFERGAQSPVPVLVGCNADEGSVFSIENWRQWGEAFCGSMVMWAASMRNTSSEAYFYFFRHIPAGADRELQSPDGGRRVLGAFHTAEVPYIFNNERYRYRFSPNLPSDAPRPSDLKLAEVMSRFWVSFAKDGRPAVDGQVEWHPFTEQKTWFMQFDRGASPSRDLPRFRKQK